MAPKTVLFENELPSLTVGNIVTVGLQIFRLNFSDYSVRSLLAHIWLMLGFVGGFFLIGIGAGLGWGLGAARATPSLVVGALFGGLVCIPLIFFTGARFTASGGIMARMGFNTLYRRVEPNELQNQIITRRIWSYLGAVALFTSLFLIVYGGLIGIAILVVVQWLPVLEAWRSQLTDPQLETILALGLFAVFLVVILVIGLVGYYLTARLWFFDAILAIEPHQSAVGSLVRSWEITRGKGWAVTTVMFTTSLITIPVYLIASMVNLFVPFVSVVAGILFFPLWQAVKAANYYELAAASTGLYFDLTRSVPDPRRYLRRVSIQTPEGIALDFALGGIGSRALAWILDQTLLYGLLAVLSYLGLIAYSYVILPSLSAQFSALSVDDLNLWALATASVLGFAIINGYFIAWETLNRGQTPGKTFAKIRVVRDDGQPISVREAALRSFIGWIDLGFFFLGLILIWFNQSEKRLGDLAAGTLMIQDEKSTSKPAPAPLTFSTLTTDTVDVLMAQTNPSILSADQYLVLRNFLAYRTQLQPHDRSQVTQRLAHQLRSLLMPTTPQQLGAIPDENLLEAAYVVNRDTYYQP